MLAVVAVLVLIIGGTTALIHTSFGHEQVRNIILASLKGRINGRVYLGTIRSGFLNGVIIDSVAIRGPDDSLFLSTGEITLRYSYRDILNKRLGLRTSRIVNPYVHIRQFEDGSWNFRKIFSQGDSKNSGRLGDKSFDEVFVESTRIEGLTFLLTLPWRPQPWAKGAVRDSIINYELSRTDLDINRAGEYFSRTWRWEKGSGLLVKAVLSSPDDPVKVFEVQGLSAVEYDPPFNFSNVDAVVKQLGDSVWIDASNFDLPGSSGSGKGKIVWGNNLPIRYDITVTGDTVSLDDLTWIHPSLPETGGGKARLTIRNNPSNLHLMQYIVSDMDVRSERSRLLGKMTFELGADTLNVKDVDLDLAPANFDLLRRLNQGPFPLDWQGDLVGKIKGGGGNLARFRVDHAELTFRDHNVPGAIAHGRASGMLNIFDPALTEFKGLNLELTTLDLRTLQYVNKDFAELQGTVSGRTVLDSSWLDVRFSEAELWHHYQSMDSSRFTGGGRITWGEEFFRYDVALQADSMDMRTMRESYPVIPLMGKYSGPVQVSGELPSLRVNMSLSGPDGTLSYDGTVDMALPVLGLSGSGTFTRFSLQGLYGGGRLPQSLLAGQYGVHLSGDSIENLQGITLLNLQASTIGSEEVASGQLRLIFRDGIAQVDTLSLEAERMSVRAQGSVAMTYGREGRLEYTAVTDSLYRLLNNLSIPGLSLESAGIKPSHKAAANIAGNIAGALDSTDVDGKIVFSEVDYGGFAMKDVDVDFSIDNFFLNPSGFLTASTGLISSVASRDEILSNTNASLQIFSRNRGGFRVKGVRSNHMSAEGIGDVLLGDSSASLTLTSASLVIDSANTYLLSAPSTITLGRNFIGIDSLSLGRRTGGRIAMHHVHLSDDSLAGSLRTSPLDLAVLELLLPSITATQGTVEAAVDVRGTLRKPRALGGLAINGGRISVPRLGAQYENVKAIVSLEEDTVRVRTLTAETTKDRKGTVSVTGTIALASLDNPSFDISVDAHNLRAIDRRGVATLEVSTNRPINLGGSLNTPVVRGGLRVVRGTLYIPELIRKRVVDLSDPELADFIDSVDSDAEKFTLAEQSEFVKNLRLENFNIDIGDEVWLRSAEANIKLGGGLTLVQGGAVGDIREPLTLQGELQAVRGTYRLNIVPFIQPTFEVESGTIRFFGNSNMEPALNITAVNTVRKPQQSVTQQDIRIRANIGGTLSSPTLSLSSADNLPLTQSDLLSYLITGEPAFALDYTTRTYVNQITAVVIRSAGNVLSSAIPRSVFDVVELQTPGAQDDAQARIDNPTLYNLLNTRAIFGKQLKNNVFLNLSTSLCAENFANNLGFRLEYRLKQTYRLLFGLEPGSSELTCSRSVAGGSRSVQQTPPQLGFDLFRTWRF